MSEYPPSILKALAEVRAAVPGVPKTGHAPAQMGGYAYSSESDVLGAYNPAMNAAGLIVLPAVLEAHERFADTKSGGKFTFVRVVMQFTLAHKDGDVWPTPLRWEAEGSDSGDKATAKAITSATKYFLTSLFQAEKGTDPDADGNGPSPAPARKAPAQPTPRAASAPPVPSSPQAAAQGTPALTEAEFKQALMDMAFVGEKSVLDLASYWKQPAIAKLRKCMSPDQLETFDASKEDWKAYHRQKGE